MPENLAPETLAYWYLRLNGFLTILNFVVHPDAGSQQETDVDILGVRFPYRAENLHREMKDDKQFTSVRHKTAIRIVEVKTGRCALNGPWTQPERRNMLRVMRSVGAFPAAEAGLVAAGLYERGTYQSQLYDVALMCCGSERNAEIDERYPTVSQVTWPEVLQFIHGRFWNYRREKSSHPQWDHTAKRLWEVSDRCRNSADFVQAFRVR